MNRDTMPRKTINDIKVGDMVFMKIEKNKKVNYGDRIIELTEDTFTLDVFKTVVPIYDIAYEYEIIDRNIYKQYLKEILRS